MPRKIEISHLDHLVLTVQSIEATIDFYTKIFGMSAVTFGAGRRALQFGGQKINLHPATAPLQPHAMRPTPGSADLCFITATPIEETLEILKKQGVAIEEGIVERTGARHKLRSVYVRDPDGNLIEIANEIL